MNRHSHISGFTVVELTIVLALVTIIMSLIVVRFDWGSPRQRVIATARKLGNAISTYRERAMNEQQLYILQLDQNENSWYIHVQLLAGVAPQNVAPNASSTIEKPIKINSIQTQIEGQKLASPVVIGLDPRGTTMPVSIDIGIEQGPSVTLRVDSLVNEVSYAEH